MLSSAVSKLASMAYLYSLWLRMVLTFLKDGGGGRGLHDRNSLWPVGQLFPTWAWTIPSWTPRITALCKARAATHTWSHTLVAAHLGGVVFQHVTSCSDDIFAYVAGKGFLRGKNTREIHICRTKLTSHTGENHCGLFSHST